MLGVTGSSPVAPNHRLMADRNLRELPDHRKPVFVIDGRRVKTSDDLLNNVESRKAGHGAGGCEPMIYRSTT